MARGEKPALVSWRLWASVGDCLVNSLRDLASSIPCPFLISSCVFVSRAELGLPETGLSSTSTSQATPRLLRRHWSSWSPGHLELLRSCRLSPMLAVRLPLCNALYA
jgi:hypothetical protein